MKKGYFGDFGGQFIPELLMPPLLELEEAMERILPSEEFQTRFAQMLKENVGRPSTITYCPHLSRDLGLDLWLKREDLNHSGAHKINNTLGQGLLAKMMGKDVLLAETGAGNARRGNGRGCGHARHEVRGLHGRHRRSAPGPQRGPHEAHGRGGRAR